MVCDVHDNYWTDHRKDLYAYKQAYETDFWDKSETYGMSDRDWETIFSFCGFILTTPYA